MSDGTLDDTGQQTTDTEGTDDAPQGEGSGESAAVRDVQPGGDGDDEPGSTGEPDAGTAPSDGGRRLTVSPEAIAQVENVYLATTAVCARGCECPLDEVCTVCGACPGQVQQLGHVDHHVDVDAEVMVETEMKDA